MDTYSHLIEGMGSGAIEGLDDAFGQGSSRYSPESSAGSIE